MLMVLSDWEEEMLSMPWFSGLSPMLTAEADAHTRERLVVQYNSPPIRTWRTPDWKYTLWLSGGEELYNVNADPHELNNLADSPEHRDVKERLRAELDAWIEENDDPFYEMDTDVILQ